MGLASQLQKYRGTQRPGGAMAERIWSWCRRIL